jgi:hypothetical protein
MLQMPGQQIINFEFPAYLTPKEQFFADNTDVNSGKKPFYQIQQFIWWGPVQNYFYF